MTFVVRLSEKLAAFAPQLTLDFISQVCVELDKCNVYQKAVRLQYMNPWIKNLTKFCSPTSKLYEVSGARLRDCVRGFIDLTVRDPEACLSFLE
jgi:neurofibromin 1